VKLALYLALGVALGAGLGACGGDDDDDGVSVGRKDSGVDAGTDAATKDSGVVEPPPHDAGVDAGRRDAGKPPPDEEDDAGTPTCSERKCKAMSDACTVAHCDEATHECVVEPRKDGTQCGSDHFDNCTAGDTCKAGKCVSNDAPAGTACGDQDVDCHKDDACDGHGQCVDSGLKKAGSACGDHQSSECDAPDTCDAHGACQPNFAAVDAPCGDQDALCRNNDSCDGQGSCIDGGAWAPGSCPMGQSGGNCLCGSAAVNTCHLSADICVGATCQRGDAPDGTSCGDPTPSDAACDAADSCLHGVCAANHAARGTTCGDQSIDTTCNRPDSCDGEGACSPNYASPLIVCGAAAGTCFAEALCNGAGSCQASQPAPQGTACDSQVEDECNHADTCDGAGSCEDNFEAAGTTCGDQSSAECDAPDSCDGGGACDPHYAPAGTECGDQGVTCHVDDECDSTGTCVDKGLTATCAMSGTLMAGDDPAAGVTIEIVGTGATSTVTDEDGHYELTVPLQQPVLLYVHASDGFWGFIQPNVFTDATMDNDLSLLGDEDVAAVGGSVQLVPPQTAPVISTDKGFLAATFSGTLSANDKVTSSAPSANPIVERMDGKVVYSSTIMNTDFGSMYFFDVQVGDTTLTPSNGCQISPSTGNTLPIIAHVITFVSLTCQ
jgi:hypothetical protein